MLVTSHSSAIFQIVTEADLGLADAYINGDFSFVDEKEGLLNMFMVRLIVFG